MKADVIRRVFCAGVVVSSTIGGIVEGAIAQDFKSDEDKVSYLIGRDIGQKMKESDTAVKGVFFAQGIDDAMQGAPSRISAEEGQRLMIAFQQATMERFEKRQKEVEALSKAYLEKNKTAPGVKVTASGLQYRVVKAAQGASPTMNDTVRVHYVGKLVDGTVFDSSRERGEPAEFAVKAVIKGWQEGIPLMQVGSTYELVIPASLAYGERGAPPKIGRNATLVFEVELLDIVKDSPKQVPASK